MKKSKLPIRVYAHFDLIEQTYQDILKKAGQELVEEDDETVS